MTQKTEQNKTSEVAFLDAKLQKGLGRERARKMRHLVLHKSLKPDLKYDIGKYVQTQEDVEETDEDNFKFISEMWESEREKYASKIKINGAFFAPRALEDLEVERLEILVGCWRKDRSDRYTVSYEPELSEGEIFFGTKGFGAYGRQLLNYFIRNPITDPKLLVYLQQAVRELSERKDLRKELTDCIESTNGFYTLREFNEIKNDCFRVKAFANSQNATKRIIKILKKAEDGCLTDLRLSLEKNLAGDNLRDALKIASRKNHQINIVGNETGKDEYGFKYQVHFINYVFDSDREIHCFSIPDDSCKRDDDKGFNAYEVVWSAKKEKLDSGVNGLENIAFGGVVLGYLNGLANLVDVYEQHGVKHCFPKINDGERNEIFFRGAVHPFIVGKNPVANDVNLNTNSSLYLIAGANNGGKTTYAKMIGLLTIMSQLGAPIPAEEARITPVNGVYSHFPKTESVTDDKGKFVDELERLHYILEHATERDLVILDEPCAGTSNEDAYKVSLDVIRGLRAIKCPTVYTTHIHPLQNAITQDNTEYKGCHNLCVETSGTEENPVFTHRIGEGIAGTSYGEAYARNLLPVSQILKKRGIKI